MRHYPCNSPQASARIVALALLADGDVSTAEFDLLDRLDAPAQLGLGRADLHQVLHAFCEDLLATAHGAWGQACRVDATTLAALMGEIDDPALRLRLLRLCVALVEADGHVAEGESLVLIAAVEHWGLHAETFQPTRPQHAAL